METYEVRLKRKSRIAKDTIAFDFEKPSGFRFIPGQFAKISLVNTPERNSRGNTRLFSLASAPYEKTLLFVMRKGQSAFKKTLLKISIGSKVLVSEAMGKFFLHKDETIPAVFLVGGIGITPVRSILRESAYKRFKHKFYLFYSNKKPENAPFLKEMQNIKNLKLQFIPIFTNTEGYINSAKIKKYIENINLPIYYTVGPPTFVQTMVKLFEDLGIDKSKIKLEAFGGY